MALLSPPSFHLPVSSSSSTLSRSVHLNFPIKLASHCCLLPLHLHSRSISGSRRNNHLINAIEEGKQGSESETTDTLKNSSSTEPESSEDNSNPSSSSNLSELGSEIRNAMKARKEREGEGEGDLWSGVAEEIQEIEWPAFGKVLGTTGVVLGVIAGSSVVLLTVNFVLAELSDRVFAGKGVQDFFG